MATVAHFAVLLLVACAGTACGNDDSGARQADGLGEIAWSPLVTQADGEVRACSGAGPLISPPSCNPGFRVQDLNLADVEGAQASSPGIFYVDGLYMEATVREDSGELVLQVEDYDPDRRVDPPETIECDPGRPPDAAAASAAYDELSAEGTDPDLTVLSGETGELQVSVLAAVGDLVDRACNLSDVPTVVVPEARLVS
jgi:hypothetical protein